MTVQELINRLEHYDKSLTVTFIDIAELNAITVEGSYVSTIETQGEERFVVLSPRQEDNDL